MPFIGTWSLMFPKSDREPEPSKEFVQVTISERRPHSVFSIEAVDKRGNQYDVSNAYYFPFTFWDLFFTSKKRIVSKKVEAVFKFKAGESYLSEFTPYDKPDYLGNIGRVSIIKVDWSGTKTYL